MNMNFNVIITIVFSCSLFMYEPVLFSNDRPPKGTLFNLTSFPVMNVKVTLQKVIKRDPSRAKPGQGITWNCSGNTREARTGTISVGHVYLFDLERDSNYDSFVVAIEAEVNKNSISWKFTNPCNNSGVRYLITNLGPTTFWIKDNPLRITDNFEG